MTSATAPIDAHLVAAFDEVLGRCGLGRGDVCAVLCETASRSALVGAAQMAAQQRGARLLTLMLPSRAPTAPVPVRSTGASDVIQQLEPLVQALAASTLVVDCTVEGLQHAVELPRILQGGARVLVVSHEHPEILMRCMPQDQDEAAARDAMRRMRAAKQLHVTSAAGTDLHIQLDGARVGGVWGYTTKPGTLTHWPGGLVVGFPSSGSVRGRLVLAPGDVNLTFKRYLQDAVSLTIENDHVVQIDGLGLDAELMRGYFAAWGDAAAYAVSHVGWGLNPRARWDSMTFYDKADFNGTELRAFAGNFLYSTGANEVAGRHTLGHFDLPLRGCTVTLDAEVVVDRGQLR